MTEHVPYLVIGAGAMGLATTWNLARRGHRVLTVEQFGRGHTRGASHGNTRNFNNAYSRDDYLDLLSLARTQWDDLSRVTGDPLLRLHGLVTHGDDEKIARVHAALRARDEDAEVLSPAHARRRWSGMRFETDVLFTPGAGVVRAAAALAALEADAVARGADVRYEHVVVDLEERSDGVHATVQSPEGRSLIIAEVAVVTAGAWTDRVLPRDYPLPVLTVTEESPAHFAPLPGDATWPSFNHLLPDRDAYPGDIYGMPAPGEGVKVGFHLVGAVTDPDERTFRPDPARAAQLDAYVREWMPGLDAATADPISCTYTSTASEDFILDRRGRIVVGAGFSGHGFKFTPGVGSILADLALDDTVRPPETFRLSSHR